MDENTTQERVLTKNTIKNFILRIDLINNKELELLKVAQETSKYFDRTEKRHISNLKIDFTKGEAGPVTQEELFDYVLISESTSTSLTFSEFQNAFWLENTQYKDNTVYKDIIKKLTKLIISISSETESKRGGISFLVKTL